MYYYKKYVIKLKKQKVVYKVTEFYGGTDT